MLCLFKKSAVSAAALKLFYVDMLEKEDWRVFSQLHIRDHDELPAVLTKLRNAHPALFVPEPEMEKRQSTAMIRPPHSDTLLHLLATDIRSAVIRMLDALNEMNPISEQKSALKTHPPRQKTPGLGKRLPENGKFTPQRPSLARKQRDPKTQNA